MTRLLRFIANEDFAIGLGMALVLIGASEALAAWMLRGGL